MRKRKSMRPASSAKTVVKLAMLTLMLFTTMSTGCSHRPAVVPVPPPDWVNGFQEYEAYDEYGMVMGNIYCLTEWDYRMLYEFFLNVKDTCGLDTELREK